MPDRPASDRVFDTAHRSLSVGLLLAITMIAFEALGVATAMPVLAKDLHGLSLYGWVFSALMLSSLVGTAVAGRRVDRLGPGRPFAIGLVLFAAGLVGGGLAPSMPVLVASRFVQGFGSGVIPPVVYASIGRTFSEGGRARMFALLSSAWVVPGLVGPTISGAVAQHFSWRWVFLGLLPLIPITGGLALPALFRLGPAPLTDDDGDGGRQPASITRDAVLLAFGAGLFLSGLNAHGLVTAPLVVAGGFLAVPAVRRLLPDGVFRAKAGLPAAVLSRGLQTFAFFGAEAFVPLAMTNVRHQSAVVGGLVLTIGTLSWTAGAWIQERRWRQWGRQRLVTSGFGLISLAIASVSLVLLPSVPIAAAAAAWTIAGLGMGMSYSSISLTVLAEAAPGTEGAASSALTLADVLGSALGTGLGGAAVAIASASALGLRRGIAIAFAIPLVAALVGVAASRRLPSGRETEADVVGGPPVPAVAEHGSEALGHLGPDGRPV